MTDLGETEHDTDYTLGYVSANGYEDLRQHLLRKLRTRKRVSLPGGKPGAFFSCVGGEVIAQVLLGTKPLPHLTN